LLLQANNGIEYSLASASALMTCPTFKGKGVKGRGREREEGGGRGGEKGRWRCGKGIASSLFNFWLRA